MPTSLYIKLINFINKAPLFSGCLAIIIRILNFVKPFFKKINLVIHNLFFSHFYSRILSYARVRISKNFLNTADKPCNIVPCSKNHKPDKKRKTYHMHKTFLVGRNGFFKYQLKERKNYSSSVKRR